MAFGFLKKLVAMVTGRKSAAKKGGTDAAAQKKDGQKGGNGRGRRGRRGRHGEKSQQGGEQQRKDGQNGQQRSAKNPADRDTRKPQDGQQRRGDRRRDDRGPRGDRGGRDDRRRDGSRRGPKPVNTAANEMRPGGVVSAEEMEARKAAHAAWDPASFAVPEMEGKRRFHDFNLPSEVMHGIADLGFQYCTDIQALSLQNALDGKNVAGKAQTGSGKTAAFLVAILTRYLHTPENRAKNGGSPRALVIAPTRELVIQICKDADAIGKYSGLRSLAVYGGMDFDRQKEEILAAPVDLLVATPGRLLDFCKRNVVDLGKVDTLVIDEADRMLDMGFYDDIMQIVKHLPAERQTLMFSATMPPKIKMMAKREAIKVAKSHVDCELDPMPNDERKVIHQYLQDFKGVSTISVGEGNKRHLVIKYHKEDEK